MTTTRYSAIPRFAVAIIAHVFLFAWFRELALWGGMEREAWKIFRIAAVSSVALACAVSVMARGAPQEKVAGFVLCLLPGFCLLGALASYTNVFGKRTGMLNASVNWEAVILAGVALYLLFSFAPLLMNAAQRIRLVFVNDPVRINVSPAAPSSNQAPTGECDLAEMLEPIRRRYKVPALAAALVQEGKLRALGAVGVRRAGHGEGVSVDDCFHLGSCTKAMTATLCALLVEQKKLRWSSTIAEVFPDLAADIGPSYRAVTLEHLLAHRSGFAEGFTFNTTLWPKVCELQGPLDDQRRSLIKLALQGDPSAPPGTKYAYSNCGYTIAGAMCERVTGRLWEDLMRDLLFSPLGMTSAGFGPPGGPGEVDQPWGHQLGFWNGKWTPMPPEDKSDNPAVIRPAGRVHCSLADWAKFATLHLQGPRGEGSFLSSDAFRMLHSPPLGGDYASGWSVVERDWAGGKALTHAGSNTMWFSVIWLAPNRNIALMAAANLGTQMAAKACDTVIEGMLNSVAAEQQREHKSV